MNGSSVNCRRTLFDVVDQLLQAGKRRNKLSQVGFRQFESEHFASHLPDRIDAHVVQSFVVAVDERQWSMHRRTGLK